MLLLSEAKRVTRDAQHLRGESDLAVVLPERIGNQRLARFGNGPDVLAHMSFPAQHRAKLYSTNPLERLDGEICGESRGSGDLPQRDRHHPLVGAILLEQNDEWAVRRARSMATETITAPGDDPPSDCPTWQHDERPGRVGDQG